MIRIIKIEKYLHNPAARHDEIVGLPLVARMEKEQKRTTQHAHRFTEMVIVLSGRGVQQANGFRNVVSQGDIWVIPAGGTHSYLECNKLSLVNILFDLNKLPIPFMDMHLLPGFHELFPDAEKFFQEARPYPGYRMPERLLKELKPLLKEMVLECKKFTPGQNYRLLSLFMLIVGKLISNYPEQAVQLNSNLFPAYQLSEVIGFLNREYRNKITLQDILKRIPMSRSTLNRNFIKAFGMSPIQYLNKIRLDHAAEMLTSTELSVSEIAQQSGFEDSNYFTRTFHKKYGIAPGKWRKTSR